MTFPPWDQLQSQVLPGSPGRLLDLSSLGRRLAELLSGLSTWTSENELILGGPGG